MKNKNFNGFASEAQYEAVFNAVKSAIVNFDVLDYFAVYGDSGIISVVLGSGLSLNIYDGTINDINCDYEFNMFEVEMIQDLYEDVEFIEAAYWDNMPKEANV